MNELNNLPQEFWFEIHSKSVAFRNRKRKEYLAGQLNSDEESFVERWDCEPSISIIKLVEDFNRGKEKKNQIALPKKMFNENIREEPLSMDIRLKCQMKN